MEAGTQVKQAQAEEGGQEKSWGVIQTTVRCIPKMGVKCPKVLECPGFLPSKVKSFRMVSRLRIFLDRKTSATWPARIAKIQANKWGREDSSPFWGRNVIVSEYEKQDKPYTEIQYLKFVLSYRKASTYNPRVTSGDTLPKRKRKIVWTSETVITICLVFCWDLKALDGREENYVGNGKCCLWGKW